MPSPEEISFAHKKKELSRCVAECVRAAQIRCGIQEVGHVRVNDSFNEPLSEIAAGEPTEHEWTWQTPEGQIWLEVIIGNTLPDWHPAITVTTSDDFSKEFVLGQGGQRDPSYLRARACLVKQVQRISRKLRNFEGYSPVPLPRRRRNDEFEAARQRAEDLHAELREKFVDNFIRLKGRRRWPMARIARKAGLQPKHLLGIINRMTAGKGTFQLDTLAAIATAFSVLPETLLRKYAPRYRRKRPKHRAK